MRRTVAAGAVLAALLSVSCAPGTTDTERAVRPDDPMGVLSSQADRRSPALESGRRFLDTYVRDGRVVRPEHDDDTVSEGQAYGMLIAVAVGDRDRFAAIWAWTSEHLRRDDGLLAWRWADGRVVDPMPAADADLDAAHALALAAERFGQPEYASEAVRLAEAILAHEVIDGAQGPVLVAGPWARNEPWVNPSYASPAAFAAIDDLSDDPAWSTLDDGGRRVATGATAGADLPADWAVLRPDAIEPSGAPGGSADATPGHGYDAGRVAIRWAVDCDDEGVRIAASMRDEYDRAAGDDGRPPAVLGLDGSPRAGHGSPLLTVAHAAAAHADGDAAAAAWLLGVAEDQAARHPSYYGDAWVALGRLWLTTDRLGGCAVARGSDA